MLEASLIILVALCVYVVLKLIKGGTKLNVKFNRYKNKLCSNKYITKLSSLFGFNNEFQQHFPSQISDHLEKVYAIIGQRSSSQLLINLTAQQLGTRQPWICPDLKIYYNPLTNSLLMAGNLGIEKELVNADFPSFLVHKDTWEKMKTSWAEQSHTRDFLLKLPMKYPL